ncbi:heme peroxidase [Panaeolus papilionaceus]|nr:heme peroxidase [Panaeolus papilionaceus]
MKSRLLPHDPLVLLLLSLSSVPTSVSGYQWPGDPKYDTLERFIYEGTNAIGFDMFGILGDCNTIPRGSLQSTTTAATWLRMAYHDSATFNITDQTGGVDGSIHFELDRAENIGDGLTRTQNEYSLHSNKYVSMADVIAFGAAGAVANCGGPLIPLRGGRVDAKQAGSPGVPEPHQDLQTHVEKFRLQGFNSTEMIELVACGHTLGGVESKDFPHIVDLRINSSDFDSISVHFDNTTSFDTRVVSQYLDSSTQNPLVIGKNDTTRSDLRIFNSDGNVTMKALADPATFQKQCGVLFERMIDTVPAGVELTDPVDVIPEKPHFFTGLHIGNNSVSFATSLRLARSKSDPVVNKSHVSLHWCDRYGDNANCQFGFSNRIKGAGNLFHLRGSPLMVRSDKEFRIYSFKAPIEPSRSISRFWWEIEQEGGTKPVTIDNGGEKYPVLQDDIIHVTQLSNLLDSAADNNQRLDSYIIVVGIRDSLEPTRVHLDIFDYAYSGRQPGSITNETFDFVRNTSSTGAPGYNLYSATFDVLTGGAPTFDFHVEAPGKKSSLTFQPASFGQSIPDDRFIVDLGTAERVPYSGPPVGVVPTPAPSAPASAAVSTLILSRSTIFLSFSISAFVSGLSLL